MTEFLNDFDWRILVQWVLLIGVFVGGLKYSINDLTTSIKRLSLNLEKLEERMRKAEVNHARLDERTGHIQAAIKRVEERLR